ncbi:MAG: hypothetical protein AB7F19_04840 [Candidatus Babeliales bacterium]
MNSKFLTYLGASMMLLSSFGAFGSPDEATKFFAFAEKGDYVNLLNQAKSLLISTEDLYVARDANGNTLITAAIKGFPQAVALYGEAQATQYITDIINRLLTKLPKEDAATELLNLPNNAGMTALFYAAQNELLKIATVLHGKGALTIVGGKKATDFASSKKASVILEGWQKYEAENVTTVSAGFRDFGDTMKEGFSEPDPGDSLARKLEYYRQVRSGETQK